MHPAIKQPPVISKAYALCCFDFMNVGGAGNIVACQRTPHNGQRSPSPSSVWQLAREGGGHPSATMAASFLASVTKTESSTDDAQQMLLAPTPIYITDDDVRRCTSLACIA